MSRNLRILTPNQAAVVNTGTLQEQRLTIEQTMNYVPPSFREDIMFRAVVEEAAALTSISLFLGMVAIWAQVISAM
jgi:hypothetical protein